MDCCKSKWFQISKSRYFADGCVVEVNEAITIDKIKKILIDTDAEIDILTESQYINLKKGYDEK